MPPPGGDVGAQPVPVDGTIESRRPDVYRSITDEYATIRQLISDNEAITSFGMGFVMSVCRKQATICFGILVCSTTLGQLKSYQRTIPCKTPEIAHSCYWTHGRLSVANGNPSYRLWKIGTRRLLGIYSGPVAFNGQAQNKYALDNEGPQLPSNVEDALWRSVNGAWPNVIFADFEVCPLDEEKSEKMQAACIESAKNIQVKKNG
jgi:hypothetical protein